MITCSYHRWNLSMALDDGRVAPKAALRHLAKCSRCRRFYDTVRTIDTRLSACKPDALEDAVFAKVNQRLNSVKPGSSEPRSAIHGEIRGMRFENPRRRFATPLAACIAILLLSFVVSVVYVTFHSPKIENRGYPGQIVQDIFLPKGPDADSAIPLTARWSAVLADPYARELKNLSRKTESAIYFLADCAGVRLAEGEFLPSFYNEGADM